MTNGILPEVTYLELIEGRIVEKCRMTPPAACAAETCRELLNVIVPAGWYVRCGSPVRVPTRDSEPEPEVSIARGKPGDYWDRHPGPEDVALVVEVVRCDVADDRALAAKIKDMAALLKPQRGLRARQGHQGSPAAKAPASTSTCTPPPGSPSSAS